jgi:hypothetical protein
MALANENTTVEFGCHDEEEPDGYIIKSLANGKVTEKVIIHPELEYIIHKDKINHKRVIFRNGEAVQMDIMRDGDKYRFTKIGPNKWRKSSRGIAIIVEYGKIIECRAESQAVATKDEINTLKKFGLMDEYNANLVKTEATLNKLEAIEIGY